MSAPEKLAVLGGGAWGTALAETATRAGRQVGFYVRDREVAAAINERRENPRYLKGVVLDERLSATTDLVAAVAGAAAILVVTPAQTLKQLFRDHRAVLAGAVPLVLCAKGIERETGRLLSEVAAEILPNTPIAALSGPSFADDLVRGLPTAVTVAARDAALAADLAQLISAPNLRCYSSDDLAGVEAGGALKNVMAIAAGTVAGAKLGASAQAAIVTRGFVELRRIAEEFGARPETLMGLSGLGDLILTCNSPQSRNFSYGVALGRGEPLEGRPLAEGVATAAIAARIASERGIDAPITIAVDDLLNRRMSVAEAMAALLARPLKSED